MVLTRAALEKLNKEELILLFAEKDNKPNISMANLTNQVAEVNQTLEKMEAQSQISKTINNALVKHTTSWQKQFWRNKQYFRHECEEIVKTLTSTNEANVSELTEKVTGINVNQYCLESSHSLPPDKKNKIIVKFSR